MAKKRYRVYGRYVVSKLLGEYEAESAQKASAMCHLDDSNDDSLGLCSDCDKNISVIATYGHAVEEVKE